MDDQAPMEQPTNESPQPQTNPRSALVVAVVLVLLVIAGGIYVWSTQAPTDEVLVEEEYTSEEIQQELADEQPPLSSSTDIHAIESDLEATGFDAFDQDFQDLENAL